jgi:adenine-specific DNA-methyltransferase
MMDKVGLNTEATRAIQQLLGGNIFDYSKPVSLLKTLLLQVCTKPDGIILDFFSGSGVTAQSVLELNKQDNGNRQFILVQLPEQTKPDSEAYKAGFKKISDITIERVKRVINGYGVNSQPLEAGFKVYQLTKSHFPRIDFKPDPEVSEAENLVSTLNPTVNMKAAEIT